MKEELLTNLRSQLEKLKFQTEINQSEFAHKAYSIYDTKPAMSVTSQTFDTSTRT